MPDQANHLRRLVRHSALAARSAPGQRPRLVLVAGGKGGVGTTTVAVNLAVAMAADGLRTVLVDADLYGGDAAVLCRIEHRYGLVDVLAGRRTIHEVLRPGPGALQVLPGAWGLERPPDDPALGRRLFRELQGLNGHADLLLLDGGSSAHRLIRRPWQAADLVLLLTTPENSSIIDTYTLAKALAHEAPALSFHLLVNQAPADEVAEEVGARLARACRRFLAVRLHCVGCLPADPHVPQAAAAAEPFVITAPRCDATQHLHRLAKTLSGALAAAARANTYLQPPQRDAGQTPAADIEDSQTQETLKSPRNGKNGSTSGRRQPIASEHCR